MNFNRGRQQRAESGLIEIRARFSWCTRPRYNAEFVRRRSRFRFIAVHPFPLSFAFSFFLSFSLSLSLSLSSCIVMRLIPNSTGVPVLIRPRKRKLITVLANNDRSFGAGERGKTIFAAPLNVEIWQTK